jgi:hypothetical protein
MIQATIQEIRKMAENRETETFALGLIVAAIVYFLFRRQLDAVLGVGGRGNRPGASNGGGGGKSSTGSGCGCGGGCDSAASKLPTNPGISIGNQSYNSGQAAFESASVAAAPVLSFFSRIATQAANAQAEE